MTRYVYTRYTPIREETQCIRKTDVWGPKGREWKFIRDVPCQTFTHKFEGYALIDGKFAGYWVQYTDKAGIETENKRRRS